MACLLRLPDSGGPGVVSMTTWERDHVVRKSPEIAQRIGAMKSRWLVGLHHNWHDYAFSYDPLFDFSMAGEEDLVESSGRPFPVVPYDACSFVPRFFGGKPGEKFWDVLYVARAVFFKRIPEFLSCIRSLYDRGERLRVLFLCPVPPTDPQKDDTVVDVRRLYESMFSAQEQNLFSLLTMDFRYPFPLDLETLAFFYRSSKVFVHFASDERRCRVAAYAWVSGLPVVAMESVGSLLSRGLRRRPFFFQARRFEDFPDLILDALRDAELAADPALQSELREDHTLPALDAALARVCEGRGLGYEQGRLAGRNLDIRLGRHHMPLASTNTVGQALEDFLRFLIDAPAEELARHFNAPDPERAIAAARAAAKANVPSIWDRLRARLSAGEGA